MMESGSQVTRRWLVIAVASLVLGIGTGDRNPIAAPSDVGTTARIEAVSTPGTEPVAPLAGADTLLMGKDVAGGNVHLFWSPGVPPYTVTRGPMGVWGSPQPIASGLTTTSYDDPVLTDGQNYFYRVD